MEKSEWRETFNRQLVQYLFLDFTVPFPIYNVNMICQVLRNIIVLSNSLKGSPRFPLLAIYVLSSRSKCIFPLQSVKQNYMKLQISLESFQASHSISVGETVIDSDSLTDLFQDSITQYEKYFQNAVVNSEEWPQIRMVFFTGQTSHDFAKMVQKSLSSIHIAYINKIQTVIFRSSRSTGMSSSLASKSHTSIESSPDLYENDELNEVVSSLIHFTEIDDDIYQLESIMKQWLHDHSTDSDHLRLIMGDITLRCDLKECLISVDALSVSGQFCLCPESANPQNSGRPASRQTTKLPIYVMEALAVVRKEGLCESLLFGYSYTAIATRCWKIDWDELDRNQQLFQAVTHHLHERGLVLLARKGTINRSLPSEKGLPTGIFAFFPAKNTLLVKSVASGELILPGEEMPEKEIPEEVKVEVKECLESLELKDLYNPLTVTTGLCAYLTSSQSKRIRPTSGFVTPIVAREEDKCDVKRRKKMPSLPTVKVSPPKIPYRTDFMSASDILRRKFTQGFD